MSAVSAASEGTDSGAGAAQGVLRGDRIRYVVGRALLDDVTVAFPPGQVTAVSGPSGSGKTTLLSIVGGLVEPTSGETSYAGRSMWDGSGDPRPEVAFVLQVYGLVPILSARENVSIALRARGVDPVEADEQAEAALARFGIADLGDRQVEELSGGQMQRVACARGFVVGADILLADEPTSELDEGNRELVLTQLHEEAARGAVVVVATHDRSVIEACDRHYALDEGRLVLGEDRADGTRAAHERPAGAHRAPGPAAGHAAGHAVGPTGGLADGPGDARPVAGPMGAGEAPAPRPPVGTPGPHHGPAGPGGAAAFAGPAGPDLAPGRTRHEDAAGSAGPTSPTGPEGTSGPTGPEGAAGAVGPTDPEESPFARPRNEPR